MTTADNRAIKLDEKQKEVDDLYEKEGLTDRVLAKQIEINKERNKYNIPDKKEFIFENFVQ